MLSTKQAFLRKILICVIVITFFLSVFLLVREATATTEASYTPTPKNLLITCLDETGYNTDAILLLSLGTDGSVTMLQIPRDTYIDDGSRHHKLNHVYYRFFEQSGNKSAAVQAFAAYLSEAFGVPIQNTALLSIQAVEKLCDAVGGVTLSIPREFHYSDPEQDLLIDLPAGEKHLTGKEAAAFARYRSGYVTGDLGRLDAQKLLMSALLRECRSLSKREALRLFSVFLSDVTTDLTLPDFLSLYRLSENGGISSVTYLTLPGEAVYDKASGAWYYALNRRSSESVLRTRFSGYNGAFDKGEIFRGKNDTIAPIYDDKNMPIIQYTDDNVGQIKIPLIK